MEKAVAFLDLLAFSNRVRENTSEAFMAFSTYRTILETSWRDGQMHPVDSYPPALKELAKTTGIGSFDHFLPFSDSIFISSIDPSLFIRQLGHFVLSCFRFTATHYMRPENRVRPTLVTVPQLGINAQGQVVTSTKEVNIFPTLFRGGISWGEAIPIKLFGIVEGTAGEIGNLAGKAVVEAVGLEAKVKGPRIIFTEDFYNKLDAEAKIYAHETEIKGYYELLWPGFQYILSNGPREVNDFVKLFIPAVNLWHAHNHTPFSEHYFKFIELVVMSTIRVFESAGMLASCLPTIKEIIIAQNLEDKMEALLKSYFIV